MLFESNYVYNLKIDHPCRVVYKNNRHKGFKHNFYFSVNSATCFDLTDQHQTDQHYNRMWTVIWECRSQRLTTHC